MNESLSTQSSVKEKQEPEIYCYQSCLQDVTGTNVLWQILTSISQSQFSINPIGTKKKKIGIFNYILSFGIYVTLGMGGSKLVTIFPSRNTAKY